MGEYIMSSEVIPSCCIEIVKDMVDSIRKNSEIIKEYLQNNIVEDCNKQLEELKENNNEITEAMKTLCEILKKHNSSFAKTNLAENITVGNTIKSLGEPRVHIPLIETVATLLTDINKFSTVSELRKYLRNSLSTSVIYIVNFS